MKKWGVLTAVVLAFVALYFAIGTPLLSLVLEPQLLRVWVQEHPLMGRLAFIGMIALQIIVAIIPGEPFEIAAGVIFGTIEGTALCLVGVLIGGGIVFFLTKRYGDALLRLFFKREQIASIAFLQDAKRLRLVTAIVFLIPGTPKDILTYGAALTKIDAPSFLCLSTICRLPSVISSAWGGDALLLGNLQTAFAIFLGTGCVSLLGILLYQKLFTRK